MPDAPEPRGHPVHIPLPLWGLEQQKLPEGKLEQGRWRPPRALAGFLLPYTTFSILTPGRYPPLSLCLGFSRLSQDLAFAFSIPSWDPLALPRASVLAGQQVRDSTWPWPGSRGLHPELPKV